MSKELTPLEALNNIKNLFIGSPINPTQQFKIIETALKDTEKLKKCYKNELKNVSYYNNLALKYKKALEIIKDNLDIIEIIKKGSSQGLIDLPDEEYELLKEILK